MQFLRSTLKLRCSLNLDLRSTGGYGSPNMPTNVSDFFSNIKKKQVPLERSKFTDHQSGVMSSV